MLFVGNGISCIRANKPMDQIALRGVRNDFKRISVLGKDRELTHKKIGGAPWADVPGVLWIDLPEDTIDDNATVIKIERYWSCDLYSGKGVVIEQN